MLLLGVASGLSPFGITMAVPVLTSIAAQFQAEFSTVQFVISAYILGLALAQPFSGFLCDQFGRRPVMLAGFAMFVVASALAAWVDSLAGLITARFLQAAGVSVGTVASRAVVRDTRGPRQTTEAMSYIAAVTGLAPITAPVLGGWLGLLGGYRLVFIVSAAMGLLVLVMMYRTLPETLDRSAAPPRLGRIMHNYLLLMKSRLFLGFSLMFGFVQGGFFAFMAVGAAVFQDDLGLAENWFGTVWGLMAVSYMLSAMASGRAVRFFGSARVMGIAIVIHIAAGFLLIIAAKMGITAVNLVTGLTFVMASAGVIIPGSLAGAVNAHPEMAGTASGLSSALGLALGGSFTVLAGVLYQGSFASIAWLIVVSTSLTALSWLMVRRMATAQSEESSG